MRVATTLLFAALVCAAQAQFLSGFTSLGQTAKDKIKELTETIDENLENAEENLQSAYKQARENVEGAYELVEEFADRVFDQVKGTIDNIEETIKKQVDEIAQSAVGEDVDISSCTGLVQTLGDVVDAVLNDTGSCVTDKLEQGKKIVTSVLDKGQESLDVITGIRTNSKECLENVAGFKQQVSAVSCLVSVGSKAAWALSTQVPAVTIDFTKAVTMIQTLPPSLSTCMASKSLLSLAKQGTGVVSDVKKCITDRMVAAVGSKSPEAA